MTRKRRLLNRSKSDEYTEMLSPAARAAHMRLFYIDGTYVVFDWNKREAVIVFGECREDSDRQSVRHIRDITDVLVSGRSIDMFVDMPSKETLVRIDSAVNDILNDR